MDLAKSYEQYTFRNSAKDIILKSSGTESDQRLAGTGLFKYKFRMVDPSVIIASKATYVPLKNASKAIKDRFGVIIHDQVNGHQDVHKNVPFEKICEMQEGDTNKIVEGTLIDLTSAGSALFSFWLLEALPKLKLVEEVVNGAFQNCHFLVNTPSSFVKETLELLGFSGINLIKRNRAGCTFTPDLLATVTDVRLDRCTPSWAIDFLRQGFGCSETVGHGSKRIFISRQSANSRKIVNWDAFERFLQQYEFTIIDAERLGVKQTIEMMQDADIVLAPHGAGLANITFANSKAQVIELFGAHYTPQYRLLAEIIGQSYRAVSCLSEKEMYFDAHQACGESIEYRNRLSMYADIDSLKRIID